MASVAGTLVFCIEVRHGVERGEAIISIIKGCIKDLDVEIGQDIRKLIHHIEEYGPDSNFSIEGRSIYRRTLFELLAQGLRGEPILKKIAVLEEEILWACEEEIDKFISKLPVQVMLPVLLLQFPAFLLLLLGPILSQYLSELAI